jgi:glutaredoxin 1|tara:strand:- start:80 stop:337 length:258 start_codon:yes stop_codon:yes gene_type:complete
MITIYGKPQCGFCTKAKNLADSHGLEYEYKDVTVGLDTLDELKGRAPVEVRSVPQIFVRNEYIGGYNDFAKYIEETGFNGSGYSL